MVILFLSWQDTRNFDCQDILVLPWQICPRRTYFRCLANFHFRCSVFTAGLKKSISTFLFMSLFFRVYVSSYYPTYLQSSLLHPCQIRINQSRNTSTVFVSLPFIRKDPCQIRIPVQIETDGSGETVSSPVAFSLRAYFLCTPYRNARKSRWFTAFFRLYKMVGIIKRIRIGIERCGSECWKRIWLNKDTGCDPDKMGSTWIGPFQSRFLFRIAPSFSVPFRLLWCGRDVYVLLKIQKDLAKSRANGLSFSQGLLISI